MSLKPSSIIRRSDITLAVAMVAIIFMLIVPLPTIVLDVLITFNLVFSLTILLVALNVREPLEFGAFPPLLLVATVFRLALNISAAKLVLLHGQAGQIIDAFGKVVVGDNYVVGAVVFLILIVTQYVVITNGAGRVSEVAARFTLDAMPGKQMAVDAELTQGAITPEQAAVRRRAIETEADFYGSMDGASKFVKGEAIASIFIVAVNIIGGLVIGVLQLHKDIGGALGTYTILTIGDGLVNEISALLMATSMGILVVRNSSELGLGSDLGTQLLRYPRLIMVVGGILMAIGIVPGFPLLLMWTMGAAAMFLGWWLNRRTPSLLSEAAAAEAAAAVAALERQAGEGADLLPNIEPLEIVLNHALLALGDADSGAYLVAKLAQIRRNISSELGIIIPTIRIWGPDPQSADYDTYQIRLRGNIVATGKVYATRLMAFASNGSGEFGVDGIPAKDPARDQPVIWIEPSDREAAELLGYAVFEPTDVIVHHLNEILKEHAWELLGRQETRDLLDGLKVDQPVLEQELMASVSLADVQKVLQLLLREQVSIRDLRPIAEGILEVAGGLPQGSKPNPLALLAGARLALARAISARLLAPDGSLHYITLDPASERTIIESLRASSDPSGGLGYEQQVRLVHQVALSLNPLTELSYLPVLVTSLPDTRYILSELAKTHGQNTITVLAFAEIESLLQSGRARSEGVARIEP